MKKSFLSDSHTHSECSFDGNDSVIMLCEQASAREMYSITITDHCECNEYFEKNVRDDIIRSISDLIPPSPTKYHLKDMPLAFKILAASTAKSYPFWATIRPTVTIINSFEVEFT